jgi:glycosyltransferase involved in cell wall biosynthesis
MTPWLSILIPVYNVEAYLTECLESVCSQAQLLPTDAVIEIIALDDCSSDSSLTALKEFAAQSSTPIKILQHEHNQGLSAARNSMLDAAQGTYVWFLDSDDVMEPDAIQQLRSIVDQHNPDLVMCDFRVLREQPRLKHKWRGENHRTAFIGTPNKLLDNPIELFYGLYKKGELHAWSKISKRVLWGDDLRFPVGRYMEDMATTPRLALRAKTFFYCPEVWVAYRQRQGSILATPSIKKIADAAIGSDGVLALWLEKYPHVSSKAHLAFSHYCARTHYVVMRDLQRLKPINRQEYTHQKQHYRQQLFNNIHWNKNELCWQYCKRGLLSRLLRFLVKH